MQMNQTELRRKYRYYDQIQQFRLIEDTFMSVVFQDVDCTQFLVRTILQDDNLTVTRVKTQNMNTKMAAGTIINCRVFLCEPLYNYKETFELSQYLFSKREVVKSHKGFNTYDCNCCSLNQEMICLFQMSYSLVDCSVSKINYNIDYNFFCWGSSNNEVRYRRW